MTSTVAEIDVLIAVARWLWVERRTWPINFSIASGRGIDAEHSRHLLEAAMASLDVPDGLERFRYFAGNGPDIVGVSADEFWMIECKGLGAGKSSTHRNNFDRALASAVSYYEDRVDEWPEHKPIIGLALPDAPDFRRLLKSKVRKPLRRRLNLWVLLYQPTTNSIVPIEPSADIN